MTLISYIRAYNRTNPELWNSPGGRKWYDKFYKATLPWNGAGVIKADLEYVARYWNDKEGFDLWEEVKGRHFFTAMVQYRALREGVQVARVFGDGGAADWYDEQSKGLSRLVERFFDENRGYVLASLDVSDRSGLDCAVLLGSIHGLPVRTEEQGEVEEGEESLFPPHSDAILNTLLYFMHDQRIRFPINNKPPPMSPLAGVALGRYPEDTYNGYDSDPDNGGGNPWFLCTSTAAELMYRTHSHICSSANLTISALGWPFYSSLLSTSGMMPEIGATYGRDNELVRAVLAALKALGDEFLGVVKRHTGGDGSMSEQINRNTGFEQGARDLTWSSGAFLKAVWARNKNGPQHI